MHVLTLGLSGLQTWNSSEFIMRLTLAIADAFRIFSFLQWSWLCQLFLYPTKLTWPSIQVTIMTRCWISQLVIIEMISASNLGSITPYLMRWFCVPWKLRKMLTGIALHDWNYTVPTPKSDHDSFHFWTGIELMGCRHHVITFALLGWGLSGTWHSCSSFKWLLHNETDS